MPEDLRSVLRDTFEPMLIMNSILQDLRFAARLLWKNPLFTAVAVLVLALAIGGTAAMFTITNALLLRPIHAKSPEALVRLYGKENKPSGGYRGFSYLNYQSLRDGSEAFSDVLAFTEAMVGYTQGDLTRRSLALMVSANYFSTFGVTLTAGRSFLPDEERPGSVTPVVIVSHTFWEQNGADPKMVGKSVRINTRSFQVVGVAPKYFTGTTALFAPEFYLPLGMYEVLVNDFANERKLKLEDRGHHCLKLVGRMKAGLTREVAQTHAQAAFSRLEQQHPDVNKDHTIQLGGLSRVSMSTFPQEETAPTTMSVLLLAIAGAVLLIACLNLANMLLARGAARKREFAVRLALGGGRFRMIRQLLTEGLLLALIGGAFGLLLSIWANQLLVASLSAKLPFFTVVFDARPDWRIVLATFGFCLVSVLAFGLGPAWRLSRLNMTRELKEQIGDEMHSHSRRSGSLLAPRSLLVVGQLALSLALLTAAGLFAKGALQAVRANPGFSFDRALLVETDASLAGYDETRGRQTYLELLERFRALPGVQCASLAHVIPFGVFSDGREVKRAGEGEGPGTDGKPAAEHRVYASINIVGTDYFRTLGIPVLRGREFERVEMSAGGASRVVIIDEPLARELFKDEPPLGRQIQFIGTEQPVTVVGVVGSVKNDVGAHGPQPHVYIPFGQEYRSGMNLHVRMASETGPGAEGGMLKTLREVVRSAAPNMAIISIQTFRQFHEEGLVLWFMKTAAKVFAVFGALALFLAVVGVYGVKSYVVARRTREIGIRMALGASARTVLWMILREGIALTAVGLAVGILLAFAVNFLLRSMIYGIGALEVGALAGALLTLSATALLACYVPAHRATRVQPMAALRYE